MPAEQKMIGFTKKELKALAETLIPLLQNETDASDHYDYIRLDRLSAGLKIVLANEQQSYDLQFTTPSSMQHAEG